MYKWTAICCCKALFVAAIILFSCNTPDEGNATFAGTPEAVNLAEQMYEAIGGKQGWCDLRSLYIKAKHTEPQMDLPYSSEIWRAIDTFELAIRQHNDSFHVEAHISADEGRVTYLDKRDTFRLFSEEQLAQWQHDHNHNIYVLLHDIGCAPESYRVSIDSAGHLAFYAGDIFRTSFALDEQMRPFEFYHPTAMGEIVGSRFTHWGTDDGLVHSAGGHPLDSNFMYRTETWTSSARPLQESFSGYPGAK